MSPSPVTFSPTNLGPLRTVFTPPAAECSTLNLSPATDGVGVFIAWGQTCTGSASTPVRANPRCYPTKALSVYPNSSLPIFSPGFDCPHGFSPACSIVKASKPAVSGSSSHIPDNRYGIWEALGPGETAVKCCPSPFECISGWNEEDFCGLTVATAAGSLTGTYYTDPCTVVSTTTTWASGVTLSGSAQAVILVRSAKQPTATAVSGSKHQSSPVTATSTGGGLSLGGKIAIGVAVPLVVILVLLGAFVAFMRRRRRRKRIRKSLENRSTQDTTASAASYRDGPNFAGQPGALPSTSARKQEFESPTNANRSSQGEALSNPSLREFAGKTSDSFHSQFVPNPDRTQAGRAYASPSESAILKDRYGRTPEGFRPSYRSERTSRRTNTDLPSPRTAHLVSSRTIEQLRAEHARLEAEMSRQGRLEKLRSERDLLQQRIEEMEAEPGVAY